MNPIYPTIGNSLQSQSTYKSSNKTKTEENKKPSKAQQIAGATALLGILGAGVATEVQVAAYSELLGQGKHHKTGFDKIVETIKTWIPFVNEAAIVLTGKHGRKGLLPWLYEGNNTYPIDGMALSGILWNSLDEAKEYGSFSGFMKGAGLIIFSFLAPKEFIPWFQRFIESIVHRGAETGFFKGGWGNLVSGVGAIVLLEACTRIWDAYVIPLCEDIAAWMKNKISPGSSDQFNNGNRSDIKQRFNPWHATYGMGLASAQATQK